MNLPWFSVVDALIKDIEIYEEKLNCESDRPIERSGDECSRAMSSSLDQEATANLLSKLEDVREEILMVVKKIWQKEWREQDSMKWLEKAVPLDALDEARLENLQVNGREGYAKLVERGGFFGPMVEAQLAALFRGEKELSAGYQSTLTEISEREHAVRMISTIAHLWGISQEKAIGMFCMYAYPDDDGFRVPTVSNWFYGIRREANREIFEEVRLVKRVKLKFLLEGYFPEERRGVLFGSDFPDALVKYCKKKENPILVAILQSYE